MHLCVCAYARVSERERERFGECVCVFMNIVIELILFKALN